MGPLARLRSAPTRLRWRLRFWLDLRRGARTARAGAHRVVLVLDHLYPSYNPGHAIRSADAFGAREVHLVGTRYFNTAPTVGSLANVPLRRFATIHESLAALRAEGYRLFALEPARSVDEVRYLDEVELPERSAFIVGNESSGVSFRPDELPDVTWLSIPQFGVVPCLNASVAAAVALYEYTRRHGQKAR